MVEMEPGEAIREGVGSVQARPIDWAELVWKQCQGSCANCGTEEQLAVCLVVPEAAGGRRVLSNGVLLCRACEVAKRASEQAGGERNRRPINIWVSLKLYQSVQASLEGGEGFRSMGALVREVMGVLVHTPERFEDLEFYQDRGSDVKINLWVERDTYDKFKDVLQQRSMTVTDAIKGLLLWYVSEVAPRKRANNE